MVTVSENGGIGGLACVMPPLHVPRKASGTSPAGFCGVAVAGSGRVGVPRGVTVVVGVVGVDLTGGGASDGAVQAGAVVAVRAADTQPTVQGWCSGGLCRVVRMPCRAR